MIINAEDVNTFIQAIMKGFNEAHKEKGVLESEDATWIILVNLKELFDKNNCTLDIEQIKELAKKEVKELNQKDN